MNDSNFSRELARRGVILPMFAFLLPVFLVLCGLAVNVSYLRLIRTEMRIANDAAVHAAGRAMSIYQNTDSAIAVAQAAATRNMVAGQAYSISPSMLQFGLSTRTQNGYGRYAFNGHTKAQVDNGTKRANSISLTATKQIPLLIRAFPGMNTVNVGQKSIATQVDRDIALVLDRSGSMLCFKDQAAWEGVFTDMRTRGRISSGESDLAKGGWDNAYNSCPFQTYPNNNNDSYTNGNRNDNYFISNNVWTKLTADKNLSANYLAVYEYLYDCGWVSNTRAPRHSRWAQLEVGVNAFFDILDSTDQEELVSLVTFSSSSTLNYSLATNYAPIRTFVAGHYPLGATAIGAGIQTGIPSIMTAANARNFAAKTIVVLTDGENNSNPDPVTVVQNMSDTYNITVHAVTFTTGADQTRMQQVAAAGGGKHFHSNDTSGLVQIFEEIANNLPTILTE
ncbi:MAG: VWA domain-containing protein [Pirellulaceae bacterium]